MRRTIPLPEFGWSVRACGGMSHACVENRVITTTRHALRSIHTVLANAGIQKPIDPLRAELHSEWVGLTQWSASCEVTVPETSAGTECVLRLGTLDGACEVMLGEVTLGTHMSAFVPFEASVPQSLRGKRVRLELRFQAPVSELLRWQAQLGSRPVNGDWNPYCFARTAACSFGWDWGPRVPGVGFSAGNWSCWSDARLLAPSISQVWNDDGSVTVRVAVRGDVGACEQRIELESPDGECIVLAPHVTEHTMRAGARWNPCGRGARHNAFWNARVTLSNDGEFVDTRRARFALRHVELDSALDDIGRKFLFRVNGLPLFAKGANLIPSLVSGGAVGNWRREMQRYRATGFNMVRVWGGGRYLPHAFYDACDELGILVWQDFMFACATYPEDEPFATLIEHEAHHQVARLSRHPSIALWCGGNEDILAWWSWGWKERLTQGQSWGAKYWLETLPRAVAVNDPGTPYWAESPYSGSMELHPNDPDHGDRHTWDAEAKLEGYRTITPRFSSEFGHQSPPSLETLREEFPAEALVIGSSALALRQKAWGGDAVQYQPFLDERFRPASNFAEHIAQSQHLQARAMDVALRWLRANAPRSMGALIWQWNDVWAGHSWSLIDVAGRVKPSWHSVRKACAPRLLSIEPTGDDGALEVVLIDDRAFVDTDYFERNEFVATVEVMEMSGRVVESATVALAPSRIAGLPTATARGRILQSMATGRDSAREFLRATLHNAPTLASATWFLASDAVVALPVPVLTQTVKRVAGLRVHRAETVIRELWIEPVTREPARASRSCWRTLVPGDEVLMRSGARWWSANHFSKHRNGRDNI